VFTDDGNGLPPFAIRVQMKGVVEDVVIRNNIITGMETAPITIDNSTTVAGLIIEKNIFYNNGNSNNVRYSNSTIDSDSTVWHNYKVNPIFAGTLDYHLTVTSPAIDAGYDLNTAYNTLDYDSVTVHATTPEIGAYEYGAADPAVVPTVLLISITKKFSAGATVSSNLTDDGGGTITARGVCWSTSEDPTTADDHTTDGTATGVFGSAMTGLISNTLYYVRSYATNSEAGTAYSDQSSFTTPSYSVVIY